MKTKAATIQAITEQGLLPLFYSADAELSLAIMRTLYAAGIRVVEYTNRGAAALAIFHFIKQAIQTEMPDLFLGIGTIKNAGEAKAFIAAGADFVVCPVVDPAVGALVHEAGLLWIPGCFTPTEINTAHQLDAGIIKLFPADQLGPAYVSAIKDIFPGQLFIPTGGVELEESNLKAWFAAGVCAVGMGSKLISANILAAADHDTLTKQTRTTLALLTKIRN
jgi:2-dehydro-3-deoxyphosphogluconate aldolase/(4S)-4-hydroxy-2-oxoglutarate aldolase